MSRKPEPFRTLSGEIGKDRTTARAGRNASPFFGTGFGPNGLGGMDSDNFEAGVSGYSFSADGNAEFNDLTLRGELISNDALISPVIPGVVNAVATNVSVSAGTWLTVASEDVTVPSGCTQLLAHVTGAIYAVNPKTTGGSNGSGGDILEVRCGVGSVDGLGMAVSISGSNGQTSVTGSVAALLTGLTPGSSVTIRTQAMSGFQSFGSNPTNQANAAATLLWLR